MLGGNWKKESLSEKSLT